MKGIQKATIGWAIWGAFWHKFIALGIVGFVTESLVGVVFFLMAKIVDNLVEGVNNSSDYPIEEGILYALGFTLLLILIVFMRHNYYTSNSVTMVEMRQSISALIYRKTLKLSLRSLSS